MTEETDATNTSGSAEYNIDLESKTYKDCDFQNTTYDPSHLCNKFLLKKEFIDSETFVSGSGLYPTLNDPNFSLKISQKREFGDTVYDGDIHDVESRAIALSTLDFELSPHQLFVKNFLSSHTPYNSLLLYHGLGTGKTCSAIGICEEHREYIKQTNNVKKIIIVASPNVQDNFRLQLFSEHDLKIINGEWTITSCIGNKLINEINPTRTKNISKERLVSQINKVINDSYHFMGYREFANYADRKQMANVNVQQWSVKDQLARMKRNLKLEFDDRLICIDEVHNIRNADDNENKKVANQIAFIVKHASNMRLLLLSGTPMFNSYKEIIWLLNLMNMNDRRGLLRASDIFGIDGNFRPRGDEYEGGRELLMRKFTGYVSFVRGENPYTFPYRIYPDIFSKENTFLVIDKPKITATGRQVVENSVNTVTSSSIFLTKIGEYQELVYSRLTNSIAEADGTDTFDPDSNVSVSVSVSGLADTATADEDGGEMKMSYTKLQDPIQALNISYPLNGVDVNSTAHFDEILDRGTHSIKNAIGTRGLKNIMNYIDDRSEAVNRKGEFEYKQWVQAGEHANMFSIDKIGAYSSKIGNICRSIQKSDGVVLIYSQYLDGGLVPVALALEEMGITRFGSKNNSLFKSPPTSMVDFKTMTAIPKGSHKASPAKYIMITGDKRLSPSNVTEIVAATNETNKHGEQIKVILISMAGSEGVDLKFIRQVHILEPWFNMSRLEQIIGRAVRHNSHRVLPFIDRNVQIYMYGTVLKNKQREAVDVAVYRNAEFKAIQIGNVTRALKEISVDCFLNHDQVNFSDIVIDQQISQRLSNGETITDFQVGDKAHTMLTDFMGDGNYTCHSKSDHPIGDHKIVDNTTYDEKFILLNAEKIVQKVKELFRHKFFYTKTELLAHINCPKQYPIAQIYSALTLMVDNDGDYLTDIYGRDGRLVNIGNYYLFQPVEMMSPQISLFERSVPLYYKHDQIKIRMEIPSMIHDSIHSTQGHSDAMDSNNHRAYTNDDVPPNEPSLSEGPIRMVSPEQLIRDLVERFATANTVFVQPNPEVSRAKFNERSDNQVSLYRYVGSAMHRLIKSGTILPVSFNNQEVMTDTIMRTILRTHLIDNLPIVHKIMIFHYIYGKEDDLNGEMEENIHAYFEKKIIVIPTVPPGRGIVFYDPTVKNNADSALYYVYNGSARIWDAAQPEDKKDMDAYNAMPERRIIKEGVGDIFGFIGDDNKRLSIGYKVKDFTNLRSKGHKCEEKKKELKLDILRKLLRMGMVSRVIGADTYTEIDNNNPVTNDQVDDQLDKLRYVPPPGKAGRVSKTKIDTGKGSFIMQETCVFIEFLTRYYDIIRMDNKRWFFDYEQQHANQEVLNVL